MKALRTVGVPYSDADIHRISAIDPWFLAKLRRILDAETRLLRGRALADLQAEALLEPIVRAVLDPQAQPVINDYCGWCAHCTTCNYTRSV